MKTYKESEKEQPGTDAARGVEEDQILLDVEGRLLHLSQVQVDDQVMTTVMLKRTTSVNQMLALDEAEFAEFCRILTGVGALGQGQGGLTLHLHVHLTPPNTELGIGR